MVYQVLVRCGFGRTRSETGKHTGKSRLSWPVGQAVKTAASHAANGGSIPPRVTKVMVDRAADGVLR